MENRLRIGFAKKLKELRKKCDLTQEELSEKVGIDYKYIQRLESKKPPDVRLETIGRLAKVLKVKPSELINS